MTILNRFSLAGKIIVLTGGSGLYGRQLTRAMAQAGATVIIASRHGEKLQRLAAAERELGLDVTAELLDQGDESSVMGLRDRVLDRYGRIDGLVNNAVLRPMSSLDDAVSSWEESLKVNATGLFLMCRTFGALMAEAGGGSIVNIGSIQGEVGPAPELYENTDMGLPPPDYFFNKGGMINLTRYFASVLGARNVRVNCVSAGGFFNEQPEPFLTRYAAKTMLGRMAGEHDLEGPVVFLLGEAAAYVTGAILAVDGGYTAK
jgi:NAD(P)-dependent dehydrogenase (short-subunit alcohol dehydrogenase family)